MKNEGGRSIRTAIPFLVLLLLPQSILALALTSQASAPLAPASSATPSFSPHYQFLGQLEGSQLVQSQRPRSVPLAEGFQYAATYYTAKDLQSAYNVTGLIDQGYGGRGETIAIIDAYGDPTIQQDLASFDHKFALPDANLSVIPVGNYAPENGITYGWDGETALDVEAAHTAAPYAHINLLVAANASNALYEAVKMVVDQHLGDVVTMSWGLGENSFGESGFSAAGYLNYAYLDYYFQKGAAEGITFLASTGDYGAFDGTTTVTADFPSTSPFVTGVGGTTLFMAASKGYVASMNSSASYQGETAWSISPQYLGSQGVSSGGGYSAIFAQPHYQEGALSSLVRSSPDVAADANPYTGFVIVLEGGEYVIGGTSLSSPLWAGMTADMDQYVGKDLGLLNPSLYAVYGDKAEYGAAFHQVDTGFNGEYSAGPGYNLVTGLGTPNLPALAADIKNQSQGIGITVTTSQSSAPSAQSQYAYGEGFTIFASATSTSGQVTTGNFYANILGPAGQIATVPMTFDGRTWTGSYTPATTDPAGSWVVEVYGSSGAGSGYGYGDLNVGDSLAVLGPVPYPFGNTLAAGTPFTIQAFASLPNGTALPSADLTAHLMSGGTDVQDVSLSPAADGFYSGEATITSGQPQGSYTLVIDSPGTGSVSSYLYVGQAVTGVILSPLDGPAPSAAPGQEVVLLAKTQAATGAGIYTSNVTAKFYSLTGTLMASVGLQPSTRETQFGVFNFFGFNQANFTVPANLTQGFYKVQFLSVYRDNSTAPLQRGNFTTGFFVSAPRLTYTLSAPATVYEGQDVLVQAKIANSTGAPVDSGVFFATVVPTGYAFESYVTDFYGYTGVPMQYNSTSGLWEGTYQIPSPLTSFNSFVGNIPGLSAGPWTVSVGGESAAAASLMPSASYLDVLPYVYFPNATLSQSDIATAPLVSANGTGYLLSGIGRDALTVSGVSITLVDVNIGTLKIDNADVRLIGSQVGTISATGGKLSLLSGTSVGSLSTSGTSLTVAGSTYGQLSTAGSASEYFLYGALGVALVALVVAVLAYQRRDPMHPVQPPQV